MRTMDCCGSIWPLVAVLMSSFGSPTASSDLRRPISSLSQSVFGKDQGVNSCIMVHHNIGTRLDDGDGQVLLFDLTLEDYLQRLATWLKKEAWCAVAVIGQESSALRVVVNLIKAVSKNLVVIVGEFDEKTIHNPFFASAKIVWLEQTKHYHKVFVTLKCPTVKPAGRSSLFEKVNIWNENRGRFIFWPPLNFCRNPMYDQELTLIYTGGARQVMYSKVTGLPEKGRIFRMFQLFSEVYQFSPKTRLTTEATFHVNNMTWGGSYGFIQDGSGFISIGLHMYVLSVFMDLTVPHDISEQVFLSRRPIPIDTYYNLIKPMSPGAWVTSVISLALISLMCIITYNVYASDANSHHLIRQENSPINFVIYPFAGITEPEVLPWFPHYSTGRMVVFLWTFLSAFLGMFYCCNLLANMTAIDVEKSIDTLQDVVDFGETPYIYTGSYDFNKAYLEATGRSDTIYYQIADIAEKEGGYYNYADETAVTYEKRHKDIIESRASILMPRDNIPLNHIDTNGTLKRQTVHAGKEIAVSGYECLSLKKYSPATPYISKVVQRATEAGLPSKYLTEFVPVEEAVDMKTTNLPFALTIKTFSLTLFMFAFGLIVAAVVYLSEIRELNRKSA